MVQAALTLVENLRYVIVKKTLLFIKALKKECLFSMFHASANVSEHEDKFCLLIYDFKMQ